MALLDIRNLSVEFGTGKDPFRAVDGIDLRLEEGQVVGVVGESGSGKSVTMLALMGLIAYPGRVRADRLEFAGIDLMTLPPEGRRRITGKDVAMIFQEPMTSLRRPARRSHGLPTRRALGHGVGTRRRSVGAGRLYLLPRGNLRWTPDRGSGQSPRRGG